MKEYKRVKHTYGKNRTEYITYARPIKTDFNRLKPPDTYLDGTPYPETHIIKFNDPDDALRYLQERKARIKRQSEKRVKDAIREIILCNLSDKSYFWSFTFGHDVKDVYQANTIWTNFVKRLKYHYKKDLKYLVIPEIQPESQRIHYHCIVFNGSYVNQKWLSEIWGHGFIKPKQIKDISIPMKIVNYFTSYLSKEDQKIDKGKRYFYSRNIERKKTVHLTDLVNVQKFMQDYDLALDSQKTSKTFKNRWITVIAL